MAITTYDYDKDIIERQKLVDEILTSGITNVATEFWYVENTGEVSPTQNLHVYFYNALSAGDQVVLDAVIAAHPVQVAAVPEYSTTSSSWMFRKSFIKDADKPYVGSNKSSYKTVTVFDFPGTDSGALPNSARAVVSSKNDDGNVGIRVIDVSSNPPQVILEKSPLAVLEDDPQVYDLGEISNLPTGAAVFEIQIKKVSEKIYLHDITIDRS